MLVKRHLWPKMKTVRQKMQENYKLSNLFSNYLGLTTLINSIKFKIVYFFNMNVSYTMIKVYIHKYRYRNMTIEANII